MRKQVPLFSIIVLIVLLTSCQKEPATVQPPAATVKVKTYTEDLTSTYAGHIVNTYNVSYDAYDRILNLLPVTPPGSSVILTYFSTSKYSMDIYDATMITIHQEFFLNSNSFIDSTFQYNDTQDSSTEKYFYNASNQVIKLNEYDYSKITGGILSNTITNTYNSDGDLITSVGTDKNSDTYEYYTDLSYVTPLIFGPANINSTKKFHLIKKYTLTSNGSIVGSANYTYTFDTDNRISTEKETFTDGTILIKSYTYF